MKANIGYVFGDIFSQGCAPQFSCVMKLIGNYIDMITPLVQATTTGFLNLIDSRDQCQGSINI